MISVVIVHWNTPALLAACLQSVRDEADRSAPIADVIVVDCDSRDRSFMDVLACNPDARLVEMPENRGYAAGCNAGVAASSGEALLFLNADTTLTAGAVAALGETLQLSSHIGLTAPLLLNADGSYQSSGYRFPGLANAICDLFPVGSRIRGSQMNGRIGPGDGYLPYAVDYALGAALAMKRSAFEEIGGFDESYGMYCEEIELARRLETRGWTRLVAPRARVAHHGGGSTSQRPDAMRLALWRSRARYHRRWDSPTTYAAIRALVAAGTMLDDLGAPAARRRVNRRIRRAFRGGAP